MRLIDADAFVKEMEDRYNSAISWGKRAVANHDDEMRIRAEQASFSFVEASMTAKKMPTIEAETIKHGHWIAEPNCMYRCSNCNGHYPSIRGYMYYSFCPDCGAKMEE